MFLRSSIMYNAPVSVRERLPIDKTPARAIIVFIAKYFTLT